MGVCWQNEFFPAQLRLALLPMHGARGDETTLHVPNHIQLSKIDNLKIFLDFDT
jgi:hypothetical protein